MTHTVSEEKGAREAAPDVRAAARYYRDAGLAVCRLKPGEKTPRDAGWPTRSAAPDDFDPGDCVGLVCGWPSDGGRTGCHLVCVDLDDPAAIHLAKDYLPPTAVEGRDGKPASHYWYFVDGDIPDWGASHAEQAAAAATALGRHPGPFKKQFRSAQTGKVVIDFIATGGQAAVPPSLHEKSGERRRWEPGHSIDRVATVQFVDLWDSVCRLAVAAGAKLPNVKKTKIARPPKVGADGTPAAKPPALDVPPGPPLGDGIVLDVPMAERVKQARAYSRETDPARPGFGGHDATFRVARLIVNDFAVTDRDEALALLHLFNDRIRAYGDETWDSDELEHKIDSAIAQGSDPAYPFGGKLRRPGEVAPPPRAWDDPAALAEGFLREHVVRFVKQTTFQYSDGTYRVVSSDWLAARVRGFIERAAARECERKSREQDERREELQSVIDATPPSGDALDRYITSQKVTRREMAKLDKSPVVAPKVTQAMVMNTIAAIAVRAQLPDETDLDSWLNGRSGPPVIAVANGLLDPVACSLSAHTPDWFSTSRLPVAFDTAAPRPAKWLSFLDEVMEGDTERVAVLQEVFGACLDRSYPAKWFAALVGSGDNGKSVLLVVLRSLLGAANCAAVNLDELSTNRFAGFALFGKLANVVGDQGHFESADEGRLKTLTGGDLVTFEQKGKDSFVATNRAKLVMACNTMPSFSDKSEAVWNRLIAIPFEFTVPASKKNPAMLTDAYWADELPGILTWALDGLARLRAAGRFTRSAKCDALKGETRLDSNPARQFLTAECEYTGAEADRVTVDDLYRAYRVWCDASGFTRPLTKTKFSKEVRSAFPQLGVSRVARTGDTTARCWVGLRWTVVTAVTESARGP